MVRVGGPLQALDCAMDAAHIGFRGPKIGRNGQSGLQRVAWILLRSLVDRQVEVFEVLSIGWLLSRQAEQFRYESCFGHHVFLCYPSYPSFADHVHRFNAFECAPRTRERFVALG
jgi:hypothetical protein